MPIEIQVGPPSITISQGRTFMVTNQRGEIEERSEAGVFAIDTRYISYYRFFINDEPWKLINSSQIKFYSARWYLTNPMIITCDGNFEPDTISLMIDRAVEDGIHEDFYITNYTGRRIRFNLQLALHSDFADIFEVKSNAIARRGRILTRWDQKKKQLRTTYENADFHRAVVYALLNTDGPVDYANGQIVFEIDLQPGQEWHSCSEIIPEIGKKPLNSHYISRKPDQHPEPLLSKINQLQERWMRRCPRIITSNDHVYRMHRQAAEDMGALRIYDLDVSEDEWVPAAGVPWFVALFGRDSLTVSLQTLSTHTGFARGALKRLSEHQANERDDYREAQPGKILHEMRFGELAHFRDIPHTPYYGTADATILYLLVISETYRWTGDRNLLRTYLPIVEACLHWIDHYGDLDGDGFQEYQTYSSFKYENVSWKDAGDAVVSADGKQIKQPKGLCELQGYVYDAKTRMAEIFQVLGDVPRSQELLRQAATLKQKFNETFWMEDEGCFAYGLDPDKKLITAIASNAGHCLWSGIADQEKAERTARRLLQEDMWSGWGIRTLSQNNPAYNPFSYQLGSIWPHDNGIIAAGFKRYGLANEANQVIRGIFDAARRFAAYRLPEVFAGLKQRSQKEDFPALYPAGANIPQAWASGSVFQMLDTILGIRADVPHKRLYIYPTLPTWLADIRVEQLRVGPCLFTINFWRDGEISRWEIEERSADPGTAEEDMIEIVEEPVTVLSEVYRR